MRALLLSFTLFAFPLFGQMIPTGGTATTPTVYQVTLTQILFQRSDGSRATFWSGSQSFDIASVGAGQVLGQIMSNGTPLPAGTYTQLVLQFSTTFSMKGSVDILGTVYYTQTGNGTADFERVPGGPYTGVSVASNVGGDPTTQAVVVASATGVTSSLSTGGIIPLSSSTLEWSGSFPFTLNAAGYPPPMILRFDVTGALLFGGIGPTGVVGPAVPGITVQRR